MTATEGISVGFPSVWPHRGCCVYWPFHPDGAWAQAVLLVLPMAGLWGGLGWGADEGGTWATWHAGHRSCVTWWLPDDWMERWGPR